VDGDGFVRDEEGRRVGWFSYHFPGEFCDPQLGCSDKLTAQDLSRVSSEQFNQEFRLVSDFAGPVNFSIGANYTGFETLTDYFVFSNAFTATLHTGVFNSPTQQGDRDADDPDPNLIAEIFFPFEDARRPCRPGEEDDLDEPGKFRSLCRYIDPNPLGSINGEGHNYFRSANPYELESTGLFGELYWNITDALKLTVGARMTWDKKIFTPIPSQLLLADYRDLFISQDGDPPPDGARCAEAAQAGCAFTGTARDGRGSPANPDVVQNWREPTGRLVVDWSPDFGRSWLDETMFYASVSRGYKGGGANPPTVAPPSGNVLARASGSVVPLTFEPEFINAYELGTKNTLFGGALVLNGTAFYYDYTDYQVSKIVDRTASNENFDAEVRGLELEAVFAPSLAWQFNATIGYLDTKIAGGEQSVDLMDRALGGDTPFTTPDGVTWQGFSVIKPWVVAASNCVVPTQVLMGVLEEWNQDPPGSNLIALCPAGGIQGGVVSGTTPFFDEEGKFWTTQNESGFGRCDPDEQENCSTRTYNPFTDAPNVASGFAKDLGGNELPNAPHWTVSLGGQYNFDLTRNWQATARVDYYWQDESYARVYNFEPYDRLRSWSNTNLSFWATHPEWGVTIEGYVKNLFDETPITGSFLNSDDSGLTTNVFTLDPRLIGVSLRKEF
jgi:outer membrane receptor protein involved in Fe transport